MSVVCVESLQTKVCEVCNEGSSRYRCPRCAVTSCSLTCVRKHKDEKNCDGVRDKTAFVQLSDFTDLNLLSDYRFLEETERHVDSANRDVVKSKRHTPHHVSRFMSMARRQGIHVQILPYPLSRRKSNRSYFHNKHNEIEWQVEWFFPKVEAKFMNRVMGNVTLREAVTQVINPALVEPLASRPVLSGYIHRLQDIHLFIKVEKEKANLARYYELDMDKSLRENLVGKVIIEFPTIIVALGEEEWKNYNTVNSQNPT